MIKIQGENTKRIDNILNRYKNNEEAVNGMEMYETFETLMANTYVSIYQISTYIESVATRYPLNYGGLKKSLVKEYVEAAFEKYSQLNKKYRRFLDKRQVGFCMLAKKLYMTLMFCRKQPKVCEIVSLTHLKKRRKW